MLDGLFSTRDDLGNLVTSARIGLTTRQGDRSLLCRDGRCNWCHEHTFLGKLAFEFKFSNLPTMLLILLHEVRALQVIHRVRQDDVLELESLGLVVP